MEPTVATGLNRRQVRVHSTDGKGGDKDGHEHSHSHGLSSLFSHHHHNHGGQAAELLVSTDKNDAGVRITRIGLAVNLLMAVSKGIGGYIFHSQALSADAVHSLTDLVSDVMTLATISLALKRPTSRFPNGYGKVETLGSLGVSGILLVGGVMIGWAALIDLGQIYLPALMTAAEQIGLLHVHGHGHGHHHAIPNIQAAWLAGGSILVKEWLYRATLKVAKQKRSSVLESNAVHHRVDSLTAIAALVSIAASNVFPAVQGLDAIGSLLITYMVVRTGWTNTRRALVELADEGLDEHVRRSVATEANVAIRNSLTETDDHSASIVGVQGVKAGQNYLIQVAVAVRSTMSVAECGQLERAIRDRVGAHVPAVRRVSCRFVGGNGDVGTGDGVLPDGFSDQFVFPPSRAAVPAKHSDES